MNKDQYKNLSEHKPDCLENPQHHLWQECIRPGAPTVTSNNNNNNGGTANMNSRQVTRTCEGGRVQEIMTLS